MWYKIDILRLAWQLLPPVLRCGLTLSLLRALTAPLRELQEGLSEYRSGVVARLVTTANAQNIERALNAVFHLTDGQIRLEVESGDGAAYWHKQSEGVDGVTLHAAGGAWLMLRYKDEVSYGERTVVMVPTFLCTDVDAEADKYEGENLREIRTLLRQYMPAGRTYRIEIYDYD